MTLQYNVVCRIFCHAVTNICLHCKSKIFMTWKVRYSSNVISFDYFKLFDPWTFLMKVSSLRLGNVHQGRPIFGMDGWSGKKGQNGTRWVGWLTKKGRPIFQPIIWEINFQKFSAHKLFNTNLWVRFILIGFNIGG